MTSPPGCTRTCASTAGREDAWPRLFARVLAADILVIAGPIWLGDNSSETKKVIERLYAHSGELNDKGQWLYYGRVGGCLITGNEDGIKHCASNVLYSLQHIGYTIPPQSDAGWIGEAGPGPSYGTSSMTAAGPAPDNEFTNRNTTFMTWNLLHLARMLKDAGGFPAYGNQRREWDAGAPVRLPESRIPVLRPRRTRSGAGPGRWRSATVRFSRGPVGELARACSSPPCPAWPGGTRPRSRRPGGP